ncbi:hypothetical protein HDU88_004844 [Geranomyces variabilis]|nr:hypothetical protein HDU88_004844 [Geranomyces variabilis]
MLGIHAAGMVHKTQGVADLDRMLDSKSEYERLAEAQSQRKDTTAKVLDAHLNLTESHKTVVQLAIPKKHPREEEALTPVKASKRWHNSPDPTPANLRNVIPGFPSPVMNEDTESEASSTRESCTAVAAASKSLIKAAMKELKERSREKDFPLDAHAPESRSFQDILYKVLKRMDKSQVAVQASQTFAYLATRSCSDKKLLRSSFPDELQGILEPAHYAQARLRFLDDYHNIEDVGVSNERVRISNCLDQLGQHVKALKPCKTSEADWTTKFVLPFFGLLEAPNLVRKFDCRSDTGPERPDIHVFLQQGVHQRSVIRTETKTKWAPVAETKKEVGRVIESTMKALRVEAPFFHHDPSPKLAMSIVDSEGTVFAVFLYSKLYIAVEVGRVTIATSLTLQDKEQLGDAIRSWRGLRTLVDRVLKSMRKPAVRPSMKHAPSLVPPYIA